jgi:hypothetical protein
MAIWFFHSTGRLRNSSKKKPKPARLVSGLSALQSKSSGLREIARFGWERRFCRLRAADPVIRPIPFGELAGFWAFMPKIQDPLRLVTRYKPGSSGVRMVLRTISLELNCRIAGTQSNRFPRNGRNDGTTNLP